ncbi:MAG TPA: pyrroloquinoline quinone biosynthesis peptide chaperone PqqD [Candidatus Eremiobacteraceae bacterium]|jgi:pyrroloquinoline quinone biosynthesis protein D
MKHIDPTSVPRLAAGVRLRALDDGASVLLVPEGVIKLSPTGVAVIESIDGQRDVAAIVAAMERRFDASGADIAVDVSELIAQFAQRTWIELIR